MTYTDPKEYTTGPEAPQTRAPQQNGADPLAAWLIVPGAALIVCSLPGLLSWLGGPPLLVIMGSLGLILVFVGMRWLYHSRRPELPGDDQIDARH